MRKRVRKRDKKREEMRFKTSRLQQKMEREGQQWRAMEDCSIGKWMQQETLCRRQIKRKIYITKQPQIITQSRKNFRYSGRWKSRRCPPAH